MSPHHPLRRPRLCGKKAQAGRQQLPPITGRRMVALGGYLETKVMSGPAPHDPTRKRITQARMAVSATFFVFGSEVGLWFVHIPMIAGRHALEPGMLGLALLMVGLGTVFAPSIAAPIVRRLGSRLTCQIAAFVCSAWLLLPLFAPNVPLLFVATLSFGIVAGMLNVAINTQGAEVEKAHGRPTLSSFHGFFSLGGLCAAAVWGPMFSLGLGDGRGAAIITVILLLTLAWAVRGFVEDQPRDKTGRPASRGISFPGGALLGLAILGLVCTAVEGSVGDWSGLYLTLVKLSDPAFAASGYAMFALAMTLSRFAGGRVVERLGDRRVLLYGGLLIAAGMAVVVLAPVPLVSALGYLFVGIGAANASPVLISVASRTPGVAPEIAVALVATSISTGLLVGPPIIGFIAQATDLGVAMAVVGSFGLVVAVIAALRTWGPPPAPAAA
jgi:predicted MFS family arabinose efflux permease